MTHTAALLVLDALACYRLTRLVVQDTITEPWRRWIVGNKRSGARALSGEHIVMVARPRVAEFITCPWCVSFWIAIGVVMLQTLTPTVCLYVTAILAFSAVAGILSERV